MKYLHAFAKGIRAVRTWHLLVALLLLVPLSVWQLRENNLTMLSLRDKVVEVDAATGDAVQVEPHLLALGNYVINHMNTNLAGPVELPGSYNAAVELARQEVAQSGTANGEVYRRAQEICEKPSIPLTARAQCIQEYVISNAAPGTDAKELVFPEKSLYSYTFASPRWSPDVAGILVLLVAIDVVALVAIGMRKLVVDRLLGVIDSDPLE